MGAFTSGRRSSHATARRRPPIWPRWLLRHAYPKPDLFIFLDAPPAVLLARKGEGTLEFLERRRREYLQIGDVVRHFVVVDADRPPDEVADEVGRIITRFYDTEKRRTSQ